MRFIAESLGEDVTWVGKTSSFYIGDKPQGIVTYLQDLEAHTATWKLSPKTIITNMGEEFSHSSYESNGYLNTLEYITNEKFKKFEAYLAPTDWFKGRQKWSDIGYLKIYADGKLVYDGGTIASDITEKIKVSADLEGALRVKFEFGRTSLGLLDAKFIH